MKMRTVRFIRACGCTACLRVPACYTESQVVLAVREAKQLACSAPAHQRNLTAAEGLAMAEAIGAGYEAVQEASR